MSQGMWPLTTIFVRAKPVILVAGQKERAEMLDLWCHITYLRPGLTMIVFKDTVLKSHWER